MFTADDEAFLHALFAEAVGTEAVLLLVDEQEDGRFTGTALARPEHATDRTWDLTLIAVTAEAQRSASAGPSCPRWSSACEAPASTCYWCARHRWNRTPRLARSMEISSSRSFSQPRIGCMPDAHRGSRVDAVTASSISGSSEKGVRCHGEQDVQQPHS